MYAPLHLGRDFAKEHLNGPLGIRVQRSNKVGDQIFVDGNSAAELQSGWRVLEKIQPCT